PVTVVGDVAGIPGPDAPHRWALVPRQALPARGPVDELIIAGTNLDPDAILEALAGHTGPGQPAVTSLTQVRRALEDTGYHSGLTLLFTAGAGAAGAAGVLAMAVAVVVPARSRGRALSRLRTMGLSHRQAPWLLLTELLPASLLAVATGIAVGTSLPLLLGPALGLNEFTGGTPFRVVADPGLAGTAALLALAVAAAGVAAQAVTNRRHHPGRLVRSNTMSTRSNAEFLGVEGRGNGNLRGKGLLGYSYSKGKKTEGSQAFRQRHIAKAAGPFRVASELPWSQEGQALPPTYQ